MTEERFDIDHTIYVYPSTGAEVTIGEALDTLTQASSEEAPMNDWEINFINDIEKRFRSYSAMTFSVKQANIIWRIYKTRFVEKQTSQRVE